MDERSSSQPGIAEESLFLKSVNPGPSNAAPTFACYDQPTSQDVKVNNRDHVISAMNYHAIFEVQEEITRDRKDNISQQVGTETSQQMFDSEGYLVPDDTNSVTRARKKMKPRTGQWLKKTLKKENKTFQFQNSTFYISPERLHVSDGLEMAQHCASPRNPNHLLLTDLQTRTLHKSRNYENDPLQDTENALIRGSTDHPMVLGVSPYSHIYCNSSWEIPQDHLSLEEKIGGGEFGQVWRGKLYDVTSTGKWLVVAVKMLQGKIIATVEVKRTWEAEKLFPSIISNCNTGQTLLLIIIVCDSFGFIPSFHSPPLPIVCCAQKGIHPHPFNKVSVSRLLPLFLVKVELKFDL